MHQIYEAVKCCLFLRVNPWSKKTDQWLGKYCCALGRISAKRGVNSNFPTHHICSAWKAILTIWQNMKARELQKSQFFNWMNLVNWQKRGSAAQANIQKKQFPTSSMNWEKLRGPARATFNNPNFQSLCELGKIWKDSLKPRLKCPNLWIHRRIVMS